MEKKKTYVLDTTVLIYDPDIFYKLGDADIVVPLAAIKELDGLKKSESDLVSKSAREVSRMLDRISSYSDMRETGGKVSSGARIFIETSYEQVEGLESEGDRKIIGTALYLKKKGVRNLILATTDTNMRIVGRTYGIKVEHYPYMQEETPQNKANFTIPENMMRKKITFIEKVKPIFKITFLFFTFWLAIGLSIMALSLGVWKDLGLSVVIALCLIVPLSTLSIFASIPQMIYHAHIYMNFYNKNLQPGQKPLKYPWKNCFRDIRKINFHYDQKCMDAMIASGLQ